MDGQARGRWGEEAVARELERRGYEVIARNVRLQRGELDLIARRGDQLWFVETKSRGRHDRGAPHLAVDRRKKGALFAAAREYVVRNGYAGDYGFLVASVLPDPRDGSPQITLAILPIGPPGPCAGGRS